MPISYKRPRFRRSANHLESPSTQDELGKIFSLHSPISAKYLARFVDLLRFSIPLCYSASRRILPQHLSDFHPRVRSIGLSHPSLVGFRDGKLGLGYIALLRAHVCYCERNVDGEALTKGQIGHHSCHLHWMVTLLEDGRIPVTADPPEYLRQRG